jgi:TMEM141 protein family
MQTNILISTLFGTVVAYKVTKDRTNSCQAAWLASEEKHTALSDIDEKKQ